jgi:serine/threonine-protein kinase
MGRGAGADDLAASLGSEVLEGPWGATARQAAADRAAIAGALQAVPPAVRASLPDVLPTVDELVRRVLVIVPTLHHLDAVLTPNAGIIAERRVAAAREEPESPSRDRRIELLERQKTTLVELSQRRVVFARQLESAMLAISQLRFETLRLRTGGISRALADAADVARQARALSAELARAVKAPGTRSE